MASGAGVTSLFMGTSYSFTTVTPSSTFLDPAIKLLASKVGQQDRRSRVALRGGYVYICVPQVPFLGEE
jgi:hypothetical protein